MMALVMLVLYLCGVACACLANAYDSWAWLAAMFAFYGLAVGIAWGLVWGWRR